MAIWHYYNESNDRIGPVRSRDIRQLVQQGTITRETLVENENGRIALANEIIGLTFPETSSPFTGTLPSSTSHSVPPLYPSDSKMDFAHPAPKGQEFAPHETADFSKGVSEVTAVFFAVKTAAQARLKLNELNARLVLPLQALGDAAVQAGWGNEICQAIQNQRRQVAERTAQYNQAVAEAERVRTMNIPGEGAARQAILDAEARITSAVRVLDGLREKAGRALMLDASAPAGIGAEQRIKITQLFEKIAECERIISYGKTSLSKQKPVIAVIAAVALIGIFCFVLPYMGDRSVVKKDFREIHVNLAKLSSIVDFDKILEYEQNERKYFEMKRVEHFEIWKRTAKRGIPEGQFLLGRCYMQGAGVPQSDAEAAKWFRKAAEQGNVPAQYVLGRCYLFGLGVPEDKTEAAKWLRKPAKQGYENATKLFQKAIEN